jgi:hypothetical protein
MPPHEKRPRDYGSGAIVRPQLTLDGFFSEEKIGKRLMVEVYRRLQSCQSPLGLSASGILGMLPASARTVRERSQENVSACISALESAGLCYKTYDESHFLATSNLFTLTDEQLDPLLAAAFPPSSSDVTPSSRSLEVEDSPSASTRLSARTASSKISWPKAFREQQCTGKAPLWFVEAAWLHSLGFGRKAKVMKPQPSAGRPNRGVWSLEYSKTGEYVMAGSSHSSISVIRCADGDARLRNTWEDGASVNAPLPVRRVQVRASLKKNMAKSFCAQSA